MYVKNQEQCFCITTNKKKGSRASRWLVPDLVQNKLAACSAKELMSMRHKIVAVLGFILAIGLLWSPNLHAQALGPSPNASHSVGLHADGTVYTWGFNLDGVTLKWRTESEINNLGFDIYRSDARDGKYAKVNAKHIVGAGTDSTPHDYSFTDENVVVGKTYYYYVEDVDFSGKTNRSHILEVTVGRQNVKISPIPLKFALLQNYPNPFNPETWIPYELATDAIVTIRIYDVKGQLVRQLDFGDQKAGSYFDKGKAYWDGRNKTGETVGSGIYFYEMRAGNYISVRKAMLLK